MVQKFRVNRQIRASRVLVVDSDGKNRGEMDIQMAIGLAEEQGLDLVEVSPNTSPPVCKIMDYGKYKYRLTKKEHLARKRAKSASLKEMRLRPRTDEHDYQFKKENVIKFLKKGHRVKVFVIFRGRELAHKELGVKLLQRMVSDLKEISEIYSPIKMEGRIMHVILVPVKPDKRKGGKKPEDAKDEDT